jgi:PAP2 superfamily
MSTIFLLLALVPGQDNQDRDVRVKERQPDRVLEWNEHALEAIRRDRTNPPVAARNLAIVHLAIYDVANTIEPDHKPYLVNLRALEEIDPDVAVASAAHRALVSIYPRQKERLDAILARYLDTVPRSTPKSRGITLGRYVADRVLAARKDDLKARTSTYRPLEDIGFWRPTDRAPALLPAWGETKPFGVKDVRSFRPKPPPKLTSDVYAQELNDVKSIGGRHSRERTAEQSIIAWFWNDGPGTCTPVGHWNQIARTVSLTAPTELKLAQNARLFALLNMALADAAITCWDCKYRFELWRPVTAIRQADRDGNDATQRDAKWEPLLPTPPFPSYTSGHSTFSGAAAAVLEKFFGDDAFEFTVSSDGFPGTKRAYKSFSDAAKEAGRSRIYGGIHFECDNYAGQALGKAVAEEICRTRLLPEG